MDPTKILKILINTSGSYFVNEDGYAWFSDAAKGEKLWTIPDDNEEGDEN